MKILLEMRPALDGHAGIPQETRLLFRGLSTLEGLQVEGLLQSSNRVITEGLPPRGSAALACLPADKRINRLSRVVISLRPGEARLLRSLLNNARDIGAAGAMMLRRLLGMHESLGYFDPSAFRDFVWRDMFARTLPVADFDAVTAADFRVARVPWNAMHAGGLLTRRFGRALYPRLDTRGYDVMIAETPYPGSLARGTQMVVRYHDAIPLLMPHTITDKAFHQASHYNALRRNVEQGAWFACVSEATRRDLITVFPQAEARAVTIHNMISHHYHAEEPAPQRVPEIIRTRQNTQLGVPEMTLKRVLEVIRTRQNPQVMKRGPLTHWSGQPLEYLLMVSTIEPRKNHGALLAAWEQLKVERYPELKLVIVGSLGWDHKPIVKNLAPWLERGEVQMLEEVPAAELRLLYRHALATACPSFGEGFGFSGVEAMRCGGVVLASDLPVHREIYGDAAEYFNPYASTDLAAAAVRVIDVAQSARRDELIARGAEVSARYLPEQLLPRWREFLLGLGSQRR